MSIFFNQYSSGNAIRFNDIVAQGNEVLTYLVGQFGNEGLIAVYSSEGNAIRTKRYQLGDSSVRFINAVQAENSDFLIFGVETLRNVETAIVVRLDATGKFKWSKRYFIDNVTEYLQLIHLVKEEYVFASRIKGIGRTEDVTLVKIDGDGRVMKSIKVVPDSDELAAGIVRTENGFILYGGTTSKKDWDNFFIQFDIDLQNKWAKLVGNGDFQVAKHVLYISEKEFIVTGEHGRTQDTFVYRFIPGQSVLTANVYDSVKGKDDGFKRLAKITTSTGKDEYLLAAQVSSNVPSTFTRFDNNLYPLWHKELVTTDKHQITDLLVHDKGNERVRVSGYFIGNPESGLLVRTDDQFTLCNANELVKPTITQVQYKVSDWLVIIAENQVKVEEIKLIETPEEAEKIERCPRGVIDTSKETLIQSPFVYLQASGSDNSDDTPKGYHLRWDFRKTLADQHIAKGSLAGNFGIYPATYGFNKNDDFVKIYRTPFQQNYYTDVNLTSQPTSINTTGTVREWTYQNLSPVGVSSGITANIILSFPDSAAYDAQALLTNPASSVINFLKQYTGEIQVRLQGKPGFRVEIRTAFADAANTTNAQLRYEVVSLFDVSDSSTLKLNERKILAAANLTGTVTAICEDIHYLRFDRTNVYPTGFRFYAYIDYLQGTNQASAWSKIGDFGLTLSNSIAYKRLEDPAKYVIDNLWPKFNEDNGVTGQFKVRVANYQDRWSNLEGLNYGVSRYLNLSQNSANPTATETVSADPIGNLPDNSTMDISYFDALQLAGLDYHMARMLGFGHIDADKNSNPQLQFIYLMEYDTLGNLEDGGGARFVKHIYMTPHLDILDFKYPPVPVLKSPPTYGLAVDNGTVNASLLTDSQGYTPFADIRFVNINRDPFQFEKNFESFFQHTTPITLCEETETISFGMEYALQGSPWKKPELLHDKVYSDNADTPETLLIPNTGENPVYRHQETEEGIHCYALYSVNWFSRPSVVSVQVCTDYTKFPKRNTLLPPMNVAVQLVQSEMPPLLTTAQEQEDYADIVGDDKTYLRVTFDYNYIHHQAYQFGTTAQLYFNKQEKQIVKGEILSVSQLSGNRVKVITGPYTILSTSPAQTVQPNIAPGMVSHFAESLFAVGGMNYRVESVLDTSATAGDNPTFILHQIKETNSVETSLGSNVWITTESYTSPSAGDRFLVAENMGAATNWNNKLAKSIHLESFSTNDLLKISGSTNNNGSYKILNASMTGTVTTIETDKPIDDSITDGFVEYNKAFRVIAFNTTNNGFLIAGDVTADFSGITVLKVFGSLDNDGDYTISSVTFNGTETDLVVNESIFLNSAVSSVGIQKKVPVASYNTANNQITLAGNFAAELQPSYKEIRQNTDGSTTELVMGGLVASCTITEEPDVYNPDNVPGGSTPGDPVPGSRTGVYTLTFTGNPLPPHVDPEVSWFQGKVRILEDDLFLPTPLDNRTTARMKELNVQNVYEDTGGNLVLVAVDPTFEVDPASVPTTYTPSGEYVPIVTGSGIQINYHPSYLFYLKVDETPIATGTEQNEFHKETILPAFGEGSRKTFFGARTLDGWNNDPTADDCASHIGTPAAIVAQEIRDPQAPNPPAGPLYATRPDFYGKSTYTMDISFTNTPYAVLVYKANERKILDTLYTPDTVQDILDALALIPAPDLYFTQRWSDLVNVVLEPSGDTHEGEFLDYPNSPFRFPIPNNPDYILPQSFTDSPQINPFNGTDAPGSGAAFNFPELGITVTMEQAVREAITGAFISQTKAPMIYQYIVDGERTSNTPPVIRDENDNLIAPGGAGYNAFPFAVKLSGGAIRFCDYNIDGGSNSFYFYYAMELSDRQIKSPPSTIVGPIQLVNTRPAKEPGIKQVLTQIENVAANIPTAVCFKLEEYVASEGIARIDIYRSTNAIDALSVRTMDLAAEIPVNGTITATDICDTFTGLDYPLYGEDLHYRLIALRKITLEDGVTEEYIPSEPSKVVRAVLVDPNNPSAPILVSENGTTTTTQMLNVVLKWDATCYNGEYILDKLSVDGNWTEVYRVSSKEDAMQYPPIVGTAPDFVNYPETAALERKDLNGNPRYHTFRVRVTNSSGLLNIEQNPLTLDQGCADLLKLKDIANFQDGAGFTHALDANLLIDEGSENPVSMTFTDTLSSGALPAGHNSITGLSVTVMDAFLNRVSKPLPLSGSVTFNDGDNDNPGESLELNTSNANQKYTVVLNVQTDTCPNGQDITYTLEYVSSPFNDLKKIEAFVSCQDGNGETFIVDGQNLIDNGMDYFPNAFTFTDLVDHLAHGQTVQTYEIYLSDFNGGADTKSLPLNGSVTFNDGDGGLNLSGGQDYNVRLTLKTLECPDGFTRTYDIKYVKDLCEDLYTINALVNYQDGQGNLIILTDNDHEITTGVNFPNSVTITDIIGSSLPGGHIFDKMEVTLEDYLAGSYTQVIISPLSTITFNHNDGELELDSTANNKTYYVTAILYTNICTQGYKIDSTITYNI